MTVILNAVVMNSEELVERLERLIVTRTALNVQTSRQIALEVVDFLECQRPEGWLANGDETSEEDTEGASSEAG